MGAELRVSGKLPSDRSRVWRFAFGYLKKTGDAAKVVDRAESVADTKQGVVGIKVAILAPGIKMCDQIVVDEEFLNEVKRNVAFEETETDVQSAKTKKIKNKIGKKNGRK